MEEESFTKGYQREGFFNSEYLEVGNVKVLKSFNKVGIRRVLLGCLIGRIARI